MAFVTEKPARPAPHPYQTTRSVNATARAIHAVQQLWHLAGAQKALRGE